MKLYKCLILLALLLLGATTQPLIELSIEAPTQAQTGQTLIINITPTIQDVAVIGADIKADVKTPTSEDAIELMVAMRPDGSRYANITAQQNGSYEFFVQAQTGPAQTNQTRVVRVGAPTKLNINTTAFGDVVRGVWTDKQPLSTNATAIYRLGAGYEQRALIQAQQGTYTAQEDHVRLHAKPLAIFLGSVPHTFTPVKHGRVIEFTHILGTQELLVLNNNLRIVHQQPLPITSEPHTFSADLPAGKYFLLLSGERSYTTPIEVFDHEVRISTPPQQTYTTQQEELRINRTIQLNTSRAYEELSVVLETTLAHEVLYNQSIVNSSLQLPPGNHTFQAHLQTTPGAHTVQWAFIGQTTARTAYDDLQVITPRNTTPTTTSSVAGVNIYTSTGVPVRAVSNDTPTQGLLTTQSAKRPVTLDFPAGPISQLSIADGNEQNMSLGIEPINKEQAQKFINTSVRDAYAINPGFNSNYTVTKTARGSRLLKCTEYDFSTQTCFGEFVVVGKLTPGEQYTFTFTPEDPLFVEDGWWDNDFVQCRNIDVPNVGSSALTNFPVPLQVAKQAGMQASYDDLRFVDEACAEGGLELAYDIEYSNASQADVWVRVPELAAGGSVISMYYNNSLAAAGENESGTWTGDYGLIYHMDAAGTDSSANNRNVVTVRGTSPDNSVFGYGRFFDGVDDEFDQSDMAYWEQQWDTRTHEVVFTTSSDITTRQAIFAEGGTINGVMLFIDAGTLSARWWSESDGWSGDNINFTSLAANTTYHAAMRFEYPGSFALVVNGSVVDSGTPPSGISAHSGDGGIGYTNTDKDYLPDTLFGPGHFEGSIHLFRTYDVPPSLDWINVSYDLLLGSQASFGSVETSSPTIKNLSVNTSSVFRNQPVLLNATVTDASGNEDVAQVNATIRSPAGVNSTVQLNQTIFTALSNTSGDLESSTISFTASNGTEFIGEAGSINLSGFESKVIAFNNTYFSTPLFIGTPASDNNGDNGLAPVINSINTTHVNVSLCEDNGAATCDLGAAEEVLHYFVFDRDRHGEFSWLDFGVASGVPDDSLVTVSFNQTFSNTPYVFTTVQSDNDGGSGIAPVITVDSVSTSGATLAPCAHPGTGDACSASLAEDLGWVAIDPVTATLDSFQSGLESIGDSQWRAVGFSPSFTDPILAVAKNSENGGQDGEYSQARSVATTGADIRYCEQDGSQQCDTHNAEDMVWGALERGLMEVSVSPDIEESTPWVEYNDVDSTIVSNITNITASITVSSYDASASADNANAAPDLELQLATSNQADWVTIGSFSVSGPGTYTLSTTNTTILSAWEKSSVRDLRVRATGLDHNTSTLNSDSVEWNAINVELVYDLATPYWTGVFTNTSELGNYTVTRVDAVDSDANAVNRSFNISFEVLGQLPSLDAVVLNSTFGSNQSSENLTATPINLSDGGGGATSLVTEWFVDSQRIAPVLVPMRLGNASGTRDYARNSTFSVLNNAYHNATGGPDGAGEYVFDGVDDALEDASAGASLNGLDAFTISVWVNSEVTNTDNGILLGRTPDGTDTVFGLRYDASGFSFGGTNLLKVGISTTGGDLQTETSSNSQTTDWQHIVVRWSSGEPVDIFLDGVYDTPSGVDPVVTGTITGADRLIIGRGAKYGDTANGWQGSISQLHIFNRSLDDNQISMLYNEGLNATSSAQISATQTNANESWRACMTPVNSIENGVAVCSENLTILGGSELSVFDEFEYANKSTFADAPITHFANWTTASTPVSSGLCEVTYYDGLVQNMTYDSSSGLWNSTRTYYLEGQAPFNVSCESSQVSRINASDAVNVQSLVNLSANYLLNDSSVTLQVGNRQNYTEYNISLFTLVPSNASFTSSWPVQVTPVLSGQVLEFVFDSLNASQRRSVVLNVSDPVIGRSVVLGVRSPSAANVTHTS